MTAWDPAKMEEKVADNMAEIQDIITETGEEAKMLAKFQQPDDPKQVAVDDPGAAR